MSNNKVDKRPHVCPGYVFRQQTGCGYIYVTITTHNDDDSRPFEIFATLGHSGGCAACQTEAITRIATLILRSGGRIDDVIKHLRGIQCPSPNLSDNPGQNILSCADAIAKSLMEFKDLMENGVINV